MSQPDDPNLVARITALQILLCQSLALHMVNSRNSPSLYRQLRADAEAIFKDGPEHMRSAGLDVIDFVFTNADGMIRKSL